MKHIPVVFESDVTPTQVTTGHLVAAAPVNSVHAVHSVPERSINRRRTDVVIEQNTQSVVPLTSIQPARPVRSTSQPVQPIAATQQMAQPPQPEAQIKTNPSPSTVDAQVKPVNIPQTAAKARRKRPVLSLWLTTMGKYLLAATVLLIVLLGSGVLYTFVTGRSATKEAQDTATSSQPTGQATLGAPRTPAADAPASVAVQSMTTPAVKGGTVSMTIKSVPTAVCKPTIRYNGKQATVPEFTEQIADAYGIVTWSWVVARDTPSGRWPIAVTCVYNNRSAVGGPDLVVM